MAKQNSSIGEGEIAALVFLGDLAGRSPVLLPRPITVAGTRRSSHIRLKSRSISRAHAVFVNTTSGVYVRDLCSREGTFVNDAKITEIELRDGDELRLGKFRFRFRAAASQNGNSHRKHRPAHVIISGAGKVDLNRRVILIGQRPGSDIRIADEKASMVHAVIFQYHGRHYLRDLGSSEGTRVNGSPAKLAVLRSGDVIRIGRAELTYFTVSRSELARQSQESAIFGALGAEQEAAPIAEAELVAVIEGEADAALEGQVVVSGDTDLPLDPEPERRAVTTNVEPVALKLAPAPAPRIEVAPDESAASASEIAVPTLTTRDEPPAIDLPVAPTDVSATVSMRLIFDQPLLEDSEGEPETTTLAALSERDSHEMRPDEILRDTEIDLFDELLEPRPNDAAPTTLQRAEPEHVATETPSQRAVDTDPPVKRELSLLPAPASSEHGQEYLAMPPASHEAAPVAAIASEPIEAPTSADISSEAPVIDSAADVLDVIATFSPPKPDGQAVESVKPDEPEKPVDSSLAPAEGSRELAVISPPPDGSVAKPVRLDQMIHWAFGQSGKSDGQRSVRQRNWGLAVLTALGITVIALAVGAVIFLRKMM